MNTGCTGECSLHRSSNAEFEPRHKQEHGHGHGATRGDELTNVSDAALLWSVVLNQLLTVVQVAAGFASGSVALLSDAAHNFSDANTLVIAYVARRISRRDADHRFTFGYRRAELIGAVINLTLLAAVGVYLIYEAAMRFFYPVEILGGLMAAAAALALVVDLFTAWLLWSLGKGSMNIRAAFLHNLVDAAGSVAVLLGAAAVSWLHWTWVDPALTLLIAGYILWQAGKMLPQAARILMEAAPEGFPTARLIEQAKGVDGVQEMHHVHVWQVDEHNVALEAHVVLAEGMLAEMETVKRSLKTLLHDSFHVVHSTLEFEQPTSPGGG